MYKDGSGHVHGFVDTGGSFQLVNVPGATDTAALGINDAGIIVGAYKDGSGAIHGFAADNRGSFVQPIDAPPSGGIPNDAFLWDINNAMQFVGAWEPRGGNFLATMVDFAPLKPPRQSSPDGTWVNTDGPLITDAIGNVWKINHGRVNVNGVDDPTTRRVAALA
jgi:hypothetical protein